MLAEIERVLCSHKGRYLVLTLGQDFILRKLLQIFGRDGSGWRFDLHMLEDNQGSSSSAFLTLVGIATREGGEGGGEGGGGINLHFDITANRVLKALEFKQGDHEEVMSLVSMAQVRYRTRKELHKITPGRFKGDINIWIKGDADENKEPRYTINVVDLIPPTRQPLPSAVLIIPQGREHEWLFSTPDGLRQVSYLASFGPFRTA